ncbi:MAG: YaiO family outer membrane beta-barrel protein, partial [Gemmatimonadota bacterium]|nr:YaiO family outer membrane beta-barrel protein [Gemmatimonadota bacterium]
MQNCIRPVPRALAASLALLTLLAAGAPLAAQDTAAHSSGPAPRRWVGIDAAYTSFSGGYDAWQFVSVSLANRSAWGTAIGRVNYANRYATGGLQVEGDLYPRLGPSTYLYLNLGYSGSSVFPQWRSGAELFQSLPDAWEASAGYRQLRFNGAPVTLLTGAVGKYAGNYW